MEKRNICLYEKDGGWGGVPFGSIGWRKIAPLLLLSKLEERFAGVRILSDIKILLYVFKFVHESAPIRCGLHTLHTSSKILLKCLKVLLQFYYVVLKFVSY